MTTKELLIHRPDILAVIVGFMAIGLETYAVIVLSLPNVVKWVLVVLMLCATVILLRVVCLIKKR